jgi:hypothetical protein
MGHQELWPRLLDEEAMMVRRVRHKGSLFFYLNIEIPTGEHGFKRTFTSRLCFADISQGRRCSISAMVEAIKRIGPVGPT